MRFIAIVLIASFFYTATFAQLRSVSSEGPCPSDPEMEDLFWKKDEEKIILSPIQRSDYHFTAVKKVEELGRYLSHVINTNLPLERRKRAAELALGLFLHHNITIEDNFLCPEPLYKLNICEFLHSVLKLSQVNHRIEWGTIYIMDPSSHHSNLMRVNVEQVIRKTQGLDIGKSTDQSKKIVEVLLVNLPKYLHNEQKNMLQIKLGKILSGY